MRSIGWRARGRNRSPRRKQWTVRCDLLCRVVWKKGEAISLLDMEAYLALALDLDLTKISALLDESASQIRNLRGRNQRWTPTQRGIITHARLVEGDLG